MNNRQRFALGRIAAVACVSVATLYGCGSKDAASFVESARQYVAKADYKAAIIESKNALQRDPDNGEARVLLATALLRMGDPAGAESETRKAIALRVPDDRTYPLLAQALGAQGEFKKIVSELGERRFDNPATRSDVRAALAMAWLAQGDAKRAAQLADAALADQPGNARALLLKAQLAALGGSIPAARGYVDQALKASPNNADALMMNAELALADGKADEAQQILEQAVRAEPEAVAARARLASLAIKSGKLDVAKAQVEKMKEVGPRDLRTLYSDALLASASGDNAHAREAIQRVLAARPNHLPSLLLSGLVEFRLGSYASAEDALRKVVARMPDEPDARRLLALIYLRSGRGEQAVETLAPAIQHNPNNPVLLRTAGEAYLAAGNATLAATSYERANAIDKGNVASQVRLAQVRLAAGDTTRGFGDLESLAAADSNQYQADLALFSAHMRRREYDKALAAVDTLEKKMPKAAFVANLRGSVYVAKRDLKRARASFEKALALQADFFPAARSLAIIDLQEGNAAAARARYEQMLAKNPKNERVLLGLAELLTVSGAPAEQAKDAIDKAVAANPMSVQARLALTAFEAREHDPKAAMVAAQGALAAIPNDPQLTEALGSAQLLAGEHNQAIETFRKLVALQPANPLALLRLADAQSAVKDYAGALETARKALALKPDFPAAIAALTRTYMASGQTDAAVAEARRLQKEHPDKGAGFVLEGEILNAQRKWAEAAVAFKAALDRQPVAPVAAAYYLALARAGKATEANALAEQWIAQHPKDATMPLLLAEQRQQRKETAAAKTGYRKVLDIDPDNVVALNNLAWILADEKDAKALEYAERAHRIAPFNAGVVDTLGWTMARGGDVKRGVQLLRMATRLAPARGEIRLHLAKALIESGDKAGARRELAELTKLDKASSVRAEAEKLQANL